MICCPRKCCKLKVWTIIRLIQILINYGGAVKQAPEEENISCSINTARKALDENQDFHQDSLMKTTLQNDVTLMTMIQGMSLLIS